MGEFISHSISITVGEVTSQLPHPCHKEQGVCLLWEELATGVCFESVQEGSGGEEPQFLNGC
jgi:hypothetical protein